MKKIFLLMLVFVLILSGCFTESQEETIQTSYDETAFVDESTKFEYEQIKASIVDSTSIPENKKKKYLEVIQGKFLVAPDSKIVEHKKIVETTNTIIIIENSRRRQIDEEEQEIKKLSEVLDVELYTLDEENTEEVERVLEVALDKMKESNLNEKDKKIIAKFLNYYMNFADNLEIKNDAHEIGMNYLEDVEISSFQKSINNDFTPTKRNKNIARRGLSYSYDRYNAWQYLQEYAESPNTDDYPYLNYMGGDCANFASQMLFAGGIGMNSDWYLTPKVSNPNTQPMNVTEFNNSWDTTDPSPWISAKYFLNYWYGNCYEGEAYYTDTIRDNMWYPYNELWHGDVVQLMRKGFWGWTAFHTLEVSGFYYVDGVKDVCCSGHTSNYFEKSMHTILGSYTGSEYAVAFLKINDGY